MRLPHGRLEGTLRVPGSKSVTNRALVAAALAGGRSEIVAPLDSDDTRVLAAALVRLGATVVFGTGASGRSPGPFRDRAAERWSSTSVRPGPLPVSSSRSCPPCRAASCSTAARG